MPTRTHTRSAKSARASGTVEAFLAKLPSERATELARVRAVVRKHLPAGYREAVRGGMIVYEVPLERYSETYNKQPLWYAALAAPNSYLTLHLMPVYSELRLATELAEGFRKAGKKLRLGKACIRFQRADELALDAVGRVVASVPLERWIEIARAARAR